MNVLFVCLIISVLYTIALVCIFRLFDISFIEDSLPSTSLILCILAEKGERFKFANQNKIWFPRNRQTPYLFSLDDNEEVRAALALARPEYVLDEYDMEGASFAFILLVLKGLFRSGRPPQHLSFRATLRDLFGKPAEFADASRCARDQS